MLNNVNIQGRITSDLELKYNQNGEGSNLKFTVAVNRDFKNKATGEYDADFIRCLAFNKTAELISQYSGKGQLITIVGKIQTGSYDNEQGQKVFTTEVVINNVYFVGNPKQENNHFQGQNNYQQSFVPENFTPQNFMHQNKENYLNEFNKINREIEKEIKDDDLPF